MVERLQRVKDKASSADAREKVRYRLRGKQSRPVEVAGAVIDESRNGWIAEGTVSNISTGRICWITCRRVEPVKDDVVDPVRAE